MNETRPVILSEAKNLGMGGRWAMNERRPVILSAAKNLGTGEPWP